MIQTITGYEECFKTLYCAELHVTWKLKLILLHCIEINSTTLFNFEFTTDESSQHF